MIELSEISIGSSREDVPEAKLVSSEEDWLKGCKKVQRKYVGEEPGG